MRVEQVKTLTPLRQFLYWISARYNIYQRRKAGKPKPWTDDTVLQSYFFTMPYRELDKVTVWFRDNIREPLGSRPEVVFATICFRWFNFIPTGQLLLGSQPEDDLTLNWNCARAVERLSAHKEAGHKIFTGAFNISASGSSKPKINRVCEDYIQPAWERRDALIHGLSDCRTLKEAHAGLMKLPGLRGSGFMAAQVVADLKHTYILGTATDKATWCSLGPGGKRGLNRVRGRSIESPVPSYWVQEIEGLRLHVKKELPELPEMDAQNIQHSLCEYDKYCRGLHQTGHMKRRFPGAKD